MERDTPYAGLDPDLIRWGFQFWKSATAQHVQRSAPLIRDLSFASRACFEELAALPSAVVDDSDPFEVP